MASSKPPHKTSGRGNARSVEEIVEQAGLNSLTQLSDSHTVAAALTRMRALSVGLDDIQRVFLRSAAVEALSLAKIRSAAKMVDFSLRSRAALEDATSGSAIPFDEVEPAAHATAPGALLEHLVAQIRAYVVLGEHEATAIALWILHTYLLDHIAVSPRLAVLSPTRRCGKTTLLKVLQALVHRPLPASNISTAAVFRVIEAARPTLLVDEVDTFLRADSDLLGVLNAGHDRSQAFVLRCVEGRNGIEPQRFSVWGAVALACIGRLPHTLTDRSIAIRLRRKSTADVRRPFRRREQEALAAMRPFCVRWALDHADAIAAAPATQLALANDRAADNWEVLIAIAESGGPEWYARAMRAAEALTNGTQDAIDGDDLGERLLLDLRALIADRAIAEHVTMRELVARLLDLDDAPWAEANHGRPLTTGRLGKLLRRFGIEARAIRFGREPVAKGYRRQDFADAFARYLPAAPVTSVTSAESLEQPQDRERLLAALVTAPIGAETSSDLADVTRVTECAVADEASDA